MRGRACKLYSYGFWSKSFPMTVIKIVSHDSDQNRFPWQWSKSFHMTVIKIVSHDSAKREEQKAEGFQISHFYGSFSNHTMAVKGSTQLCVGWLTAWDLWGQFRYWDRCAETRSAPSVTEPFMAVWRKGAGKRGLECVFFPVAFRPSFLLSFRASFTLFLRQELWIKTKKL